MVTDGLLSLTTTLQTMMLLLLIVFLSTNCHFFNFIFKMYFVYDFGIKVELR